MKLSVLVVSFLLLVSAFTFLPAVGAFSPATVAKTGSAPASVTGATATIDYAILAGYSVSVTRTISLANPIGNTAISSFTISIPKAAASVAPTGAIYAGTTGTVATFGTGPWAVVFTGSGSPAVLVPGGATVTLTLTFTTETTFGSATGVSDAYALSTAVTDTTGAETSLASITVYETGSTSASLTLTPASGTLTAGTPFNLKASGTDSGLPLVVTASGSLSNNAHGVSTKTTLSPSSFTTGPNTGSQSISVNDTKAETLTLTVSGGSLVAPSTGGPLTASTVGLTINPATVTAVAVAIIIGGTTYTPTTALDHTLNVTNTMGLTSIAGGASGTNEIVVSTADKYGNAAPFGAAETVTVTAVTLAGQAAGFSDTATVYSGTYPYTPAGGVSPTESVTIGALATSVPLAVSTYFFFGVDYGASSYLLASSSGSGLSSGLSSMVNTYTLNAAALTITPSTAAPKAGHTITLTATVAGVQQANVPVNFANTTDTIGLFTNGLTKINATTSVASGAESAVVTFTPSTKAGATVAFVGKDALPGTNGVFAYNSATGASGTITTAAGTATNLAIGTYFDQGITHPSSFTTAKGQLYVDANATDAYGNVAPLATTTQVTLSTSGGSGLSQSIVWILATGHDTAGSGYVVVFVPASSGTSFTVSGSATVGNAILSGSATVTIVSATPSLTLTSPLTITTGVPSTVNGTAVVSPGVSVSGAPGYIKGIQYSLNGATNVTVVNGTSAATAATLKFQFTLLLTGANNIKVFAEDSAGNWALSVTTIPVVAPGLTFTTGTGTGNQPKLYQFPNGGPESVNSTFTNNGATSITILVIANIFTTGSPAVPITPSPSSTATVAAGATVQTFELLNGLAHGTYTVTINVYTTSYVSISPTYTVTVTV